MTLVPYHAEVDRATPGRPSAVYDLTVIEAEVVKPSPWRLIRAIALRDDTKHDIEVVGFMVPFLGLFIGDFACMPLWAALPGCAVIVACLFITIIVLAGHSTPSGPPRNHR